MGYSTFSFLINLLVHAESVKRQSKIILLDQRREWMKIKGKEKAGSSHVWWKEGRIQNDDDGIKEKEQEDREDSSTKYKRNFIILFYPGGHVLQSRQPSPFRPTLVKTLL